MFHGSLVAIITPMLANGDIDEKALRKLVEFHIEQGTQAIVAVGTTGESPTLTEAEQLQVIRLVINQAKGRVPVIAGTGSNCTAKTIKATTAAMEAGADAALIVTPYYNKPGQEGLFQHYQQIAETVPIPIIMYNVPGRTGVDLLPETVSRLAAITNIVGIKEATGNVERAGEIISACKESIDVYSGDDITALELMRHGAKGVISVTANVAPQLMQEMCAAALAGRWEEAEAINNKLMPLHKNLFVESNPIPVKWAAHKMGLVDEGIRLPLTVLAKENQQILAETMARITEDG